jgi:predicted AAA+ superfamily ATPase
LQKKYSFFVKAGDVQLGLAESNRWWRSAKWQEADPDLRRARSAPFHYRSGALEDLTQGGLYVLRGPRRVGKSTEIKYEIADLIADGVPPRNIIHAAVDGWRATDLRTLVTSASTTFLAGVTGTRYWFIDEISSVSGDWPNMIKNLRDNDPGFATDTVVLTGSSAARLHEVRKALAGRRGPVDRSDRIMLPMRFTDFVRVAHPEMPTVNPIPPDQLADADLYDQVRELLPYVSDLVPLWEAYLRVGGFPQAVAGWRTTGDVETPFAQAMWDVVYGGAINTERFSAPQTLAMLSSLTTNLCSPLNVSDLAREVDAAHAAVKARLADLAVSFLLWPCHREQGLLPKLNAQTKWYFTDPVLARMAVGRGYGREPDLTQLSEQQVGLALLRALDAAAPGTVDEYSSLMYYRHATGSEIDFVGRGLGPAAVESKYVDDDRWGRTRQGFHATPWHGIVASRSTTHWEAEISVLPAPFLVLLLGS